MELIGMRFTLFVLCAEIVLSFVLGCPQKSHLNDTFPFSKSTDNTYTFHVAYPVEPGTSEKWYIRFEFHPAVDYFAVVDPCDGYLDNQSNRVFKLSGKHNGRLGLSIAAEWRGNAQTVNITLCDKFYYTVHNLTQLELKPVSEKNYQGKCLTESDIGNMWWAKNCSEICSCEAVKGNIGTFTCNSRCQQYDDMASLQTPTQWRDWCNKVRQDRWERDGNYYCISNFCKKMIQLSSPKN
ncbi:uncharacterized protein LOC106162994 [Lingula anatina]|uniref:Uncharacterized protein LOC106162994 n=1 Tax=Lingula anatina TaxID=7574 RepID=A0A1S3IDH4_LINAN|nr:uncharacterized protein LOC106162994 [Lingula anatina]|eukprot:XP_013395911.1 uncharacterized protein LOC106162994 [Lingula anatina]